MKPLFISCLLLAMMVPAFAADQPAPGNAARQVRIRDIATIEGIRDNPLIGYGLVVGLNGTGDRQQTVFTTQMLANIMQKMGTQVPSTMRVNNVAAVFVTASLPPFARPGTAIDVTVSSVGDAKSLEGGTLLLAPLRASSGDVYATAQGPLSIGGYSAGPGGNSKQVNHPTVGRIPNGAIVEKDNSIQLAALPRISLLLREADFTTAEHVVEAVNHDLGRAVAHAVDSRRIELATFDSNLGPITALLARVQGLAVTVEAPARVVVNERTGTIVLGQQVRLGAVSILHGNLTIEIATRFEVSQPNAFAQGETKVVPRQSVQAVESPARRIELTEGATVQQLLDGLQTIGATSRDVISILQAIKAAGGMQAELEIL